MSVSDPAGPAPRSHAGDLIYAARYYLGSRIGLVAIAASALGIGAYYNWAWLVAAGIAPILLMALPCAAMCALGLCKRGDSKGPTGTAEGSGGEQSLKLAASPDESQTGTSDQPTQLTSAAAPTAAEELSERSTTMRKTIRTIITTSLAIAGLAVISPAYAHKQKQPAMQSDMMKDGGMDGMMGMMEKMNKMMDLCSKMMEGKMDGKDGSDMKMPMEPPAAPEKKS